MKTQVDHVIHSAIRKPEDSINVLYMGYDGWFESLFSLSAVMCYMSQDGLCYEWGGVLPNTYTVLPKGMAYIPNRIDIDMIICNSRQEQTFKAAEVADAYHIPLVLIEHELPGSTSSPKLRKYVNSRLPERCYHVVPDQMVADEWYLEKDTHVIPYGLPYAPANIRKHNVLVAGDYNHDDYGLLNALINCNPDTATIGNNPGLTQPYKNLSDVVEAMSECYICITALSETKSPIVPMLAMSTGAVVICNRTKWTEHIIEDGKNGFLFDSVSDVKKIVRKLVNDKDLIEEIGTAAQRKIVSQHPYQTFNDNWIKLIHELSTRTYKR
jgi:glycosyltransferase involved in cell wall biosynthesis